ncbi:hypothetical protein ACGFWE_13645 [Streptomyces sp. NPDC048523]|uniref:hypothetical protein n=1 Tax=Streptomyces sp. NPDC048523 TaxID=3365567 RepID=UPI00371AB31A
MRSDRRPVPDAAWATDAASAMDAAWATVCFPAARSGPSALRAGGSHERSSLAVWRSDSAHGPVLVRSDPLPSPTGGRGQPYPAPCPHPPGGPLPCDVHLWVDADSPERAALAAHADVLVSRAPLPPDAARRRVLDLLTAHPGCLAAAVPDTSTACVVGVRDASGAVSFVRPSRGGRSDAPLPPHTVASVVHAWTVAGRPPEALRRLAPV